MSMFRHESECTADAGVMGHLGCTTPGCSCRSYASSTSSDSNSLPGKPSDYWYEPAQSTAPDTKLKYEFIVHQTDKAILFAFKGEHGVYQQWIPRSVITAQTDKKVSVKSWFARRFV